MPDHPNFSDTQTHWARDCIAQLAQRNLVNGYPGGQFRPDVALTRAEFAAVIQRSFPNVAPVRSAIDFVDVPSSHWAFQAIQAAYRRGFLSGYPGRSFRPSQPIPRVQALVALVSGLRYPVNRTSPTALGRYFDDAAQVPTYAIAAITAAAEQYLIVNYPNVRQLNPTRSATRGEVAALICRALRLPGVPLQSVVGLDFIVIQPQFQQAESFSDRLARVKVGNRYGYIDKQGRLAIQPQFQQAESFSDGLALVRTDRGLREGQ